MTIRELAHRHVIEHGMTEQEATKMLDAFARGEGSDIGWNERVSSLVPGLEKRIDDKAVGWLMAHRQNGG
jgi:hypothetical protein